MWESLTVGRDYDAAWAVLIEEACRIADRLDKMHALLSGDIESWARIEDDYSGGGSHKEIVLIFDDALAEARQQANALRQIVTSLKLGTATDKKSGEVSALDELTAKRRDRRAAPAS